MAVFVKNRVHDAGVGVQRCVVEDDSLLDPATEANFNTSANGDIRTNLGGRVNVGTLVDVAWLDDLALELRVLR